MERKRKRSPPRRWTMNEKQLGKNIRAVRKRRGLTQESLAELSGFSLQHVGDIEHGTVNPTLSCLLKLADVMSVTVSDFFGAEPDREPTEEEMRSCLLDFIQKANKKNLSAFYLVYRGLR